MCNENLIVLKNIHYQNSPRIKKSESGSNWHIFLFIKNFLKIIYLLF